MADLEVRLSDEERKSVEAGKDVDVSRLRGMTLEQINDWIDSQADWKRVAKVLVRLIIASWRR